MCFRSPLSISWFPFSSRWGGGDTPLPHPPPTRHFVARTRASPLFITIHAPPSTKSWIRHCITLWGAGCAREHFGADRKSQISALSSVQLSPNRVREDYTYDTVDVFLVFQVSPDTAKYIPAMSPVTPPGTRSVLTSPIPPGPDSMLPAIIASVDSISG